MFYHVAIHTFIIKYLWVMLCPWTFLQLPRLKKSFKTSEFLCFHSESLLVLLYLLPGILYLMSVLDSKTFFSILKIIVLHFILRKYFQKVLKNAFPLHISHLWKSFTNHSHCSVKKLGPNVINKSNSQSRIWKELLKISKCILCKIKCTF